MSAERRPGRPKPTEPKIQISLRITTDQRKRLDFMAAALEKEKGAIVGEAIDNMWQEHGDKVKEIAKNA